MRKTPLRLRLAMLAALMWVGVAIQWLRASDDLTDQLRALAPESIVADAKQFPNRFGNPRRIDVTFQRADFQGTGQFDFFVVGYTDGALWAIRLLRLTSGRFQVLDTPLDRTKVGLVGGARLEIELVDIDNDGVPEVVVRSFGVRTNYSLWALKFTGNALRLVTPADGLGDAELKDVDGDGILEIVTPPPCLGGPDTESCKEPFKVYKLDKQTGQFKLAFTSLTDPANATAGTSRAEEVFAFRTILTPRRFELDQVLRATRGLSREEGVVTVRLGNLRAVTPGKLFAPVEVSDVDSSSLVLGRNIKVLRTELRNPEQDDEAEGHQAAGGAPPQGVPPKGRFIGVFLEVKFSREALLAFLPKAQPDKPLQAGDVLTVDLTGKMRNGAPLHASVGVLIKGEHDDKNDHHDKD